MPIGQVTCPNCLVIIGRVATAHADRDTGLRSITRSERATTDSGILTPSAAAVLRFNASSKTGTDIVRRPGTEIGLFVRTRDQLDRARAAVRGSGHEVFELSDRGDDPADQISIGTMHLAKGLEFKAVAVMACDDEVLPLQERIESVADEVDLDDVYETERQLLYVACTRARDRLLVSGVQPGSEFLNDLK
jgi:superfamily I DNA/RNA helicase